MNFQKAMQRYLNLRAQYESKQLSGDDFEFYVGQMVIQDTLGRFWQIGVESGKWYRQEGESWIEDTPLLAELPAEDPRHMLSRLLDQPVLEGKRSQHMRYLIGALLFFLAAVALIVIISILMLNGRFGPNACITCPPLFSMAVTVMLVASPAALLLLRHSLQVDRSHSQAWEQKRQAPKKR